VTRPKSFMNFIRPVVGCCEQDVNNGPLYPQGGGNSYQFFDLA
jgi:hypothetical protein